MRVQRVKRQSLIVHLCILGVFLWIAVGVAPGQTTTGSVYGTVADSSGAVLPNAQVTVTNVHTGETHTARTNGSGDYLFPMLAPGEYTVSAQSEGFKRQTQSGIRLDANQNVHASFNLQLGSVEENVTVEADSALVDTRSSQVGETIDQKRIEDLPLNSRDPYALVTIAPGVTNYAPDVQTGSRQGVQFSVNGVPASNSAFYLDGGYDTNLWRFGGNLLPNPDALQEFRILTSNFDAEFGRSAGGVVSAITRSGTDQFHGAVYDYLRNDALDAKNYFLNDVSPLKQNQFGASFGGPVIHQKAFFFLSYQGMRIRQPANIASSSLVTPTALEATGDFRNTPAKSQPKNVSCNGVQYVICPNLLDPVALSLLKYVPVGDSTAGNNYGHPEQQSANGNLNADQGLARIDYQLTNNHQLAIMYFMSRGTSNSPNAGANQILDYAGMQNYEGQYNANVSDTWVVSPNKVNNLRIFYSLNHYIISNIYGNQHMLSDLGSQIAEGGNYNAQPYFSVTGYWTMGTSNAGPNNLPSSSLGASDTFSWMLGNHEIKMGGSYVYDRFASTGGASSNGIFTFTGSTSGNALVDFLEGHANSFTQNNGVLFRTHSQDPSAFFQDNWRLTHKLTLNLGIRWEYFPTYTGQDNTGTFIPYVQSQRFPTAPLGLLSSGDPGIPDGVQRTPRNNFAPRIGFAYDLFGNGKSSLRGGYGIFYSAVDQVAVSNNLVQQPFSRTITLSKTKNLVNPFAPNADPFPYTPDPQNAVFVSGATLYALPAGVSDIPSVQQYNLTFQQQYGTKWSSQIGYIGNVGRHFYITRDENSPVYSDSCNVPNSACTTTAGLNNRRPYQPTPTTYTFSKISLAAPVSNSSYNSLQASLTRRFDHHFSLTMSYVWSKAMGNGAVVDNNDVTSSYGLADIDVPQKFVASYIWLTPDINVWGVLGKKVLSGWQLNGITTIRTGTPFNITSGTDTNYDGTNNDRPDQIANPVLDSGRSRQAKIQQYFNTAAFGLPTMSPYGSTAYNALIGPGLVDTDISASKTFAITEKSNLQFRVDLFNAFNNVNLNNPNAVMSSPKFGTIGGAADPRITQLSLRYSF